MGVYSPMAKENGAQLSAAGSHSCKRKQEIREEV